MSGPPHNDLRERLARWLREWDMSRRQPPAPPKTKQVSRKGPKTRDTIEADRRRVRGMVSDFDRGPLETGQIRLLAARLVPDATRPVYVAVFRDWGPGWKLVAPFGGLGEPATPGELLLEREAHPLRVLCLWNTHSQPDGALEESWLIDHLTEDELRDAWAVFRHVATGAPLPETVGGRVGAPIGGPDDPRIAYQGMEMAAMRPLLERAAAAIERPSAPKGTRTAGGRGRFSDVVRMARTRQTDEARWVALRSAEIKAAPAEEVFRCEKGDARLRVCLELDWETLSFLVLDKAGEPSRVLDGAAIVDPGGKAVAKIRGSRARLPAAAVMRGFGLRDKAGHRIGLRRERAA